MISRLRGQLIDKAPNTVLVEVMGVGYELDISSMTFNALPPIDEEVILHTQPIIREDSHSLIGFSSQDERTIFRTIIKINGVGPKLALAILSSISIPELLKAIEHKSLAVLVSISGVGKKTAERIIVELKDKLPQLELEQDFQVTSVRGQGIDLTSTTEAHYEAISALMTLGYKQQEASQLVSMVDAKSNCSTSQELIRLALKEKAK